VCSCYAQLLLIQHPCRKYRSPHHRLSAVTLSQRAVWPILVPTGADNGNSGVCRVLDQTDKTPSNGLPLTTPPPPGVKPAIGAAADGQQHFSEQEERHGLGPSTLSLSQEPNRHLLCSSSRHSRFAITWKEDRSACAAFQHSMAKDNVPSCHI